MRRTFLSTSCNRIFRGLLAAGAVAVLSGCLGPFPAQPVTLEGAELRPEVFFAGRTQGVGTLTRLFGRRETLRVEGRGSAGADGVFRLHQVVTSADGRVEERTWHLRRSGRGAYAASLSDAAGPVSVEVTGNRAEIRYLLRQPAVRVRQSLYMRPDGRSVLNQTTITVLGIPWARLSEEITRLDPGAD